MSRTLFRDASVLDGSGADPFAADGRSFGYVPASNPLLYSVGSDGRDDGGSIKLKRKVVEEAAPGSPWDRWQWEREDVLFLLERVAPPPPAATKESTDGN